MTISFFTKITNEIFNFTYEFLVFSQEAIEFPKAFTSNFIFISLKDENVLVDNLGKIGVTKID